MFIDAIKLNMTESEVLSKLKEPALRETHNNCIYLFYLVQDPAKKSNCFLFLIKLQIKNTTKLPHVIAIQKLQ